MARPLTDKQRRALVCRCCDELTIEETARQMGGINRRNVQRLIDRAYGKLGVKSIGGACFFLGVRGAVLSGQRREGAR